ncbi:MAG TPA: hypothetical protein VMX16_01500 [Terriglobia bacterium]|nr:hypothetical protein [Terriglobia bacterium]
MLTKLSFGSILSWAVAFLLFIALDPGFALGAAYGVNPPRRPKEAAVEWKSAARWKRGLGSVRGTLFIRRDGIRFQPDRGNPWRWQYEEIQTFYATPRRLILTGYSSRHWCLPGTRVFRFDLNHDMPPTIAFRLAKSVGKPSRNVNPLAHTPAFASLAAQHSRRGSGTNGVLRFRNSGIDYVTARPGDSRSWRWADIQTVASPDPYHFRVAGFREIYDFDLERPMSRRLFDHIWERVYARGLQLSPGNGGDGR